MTLSSKFVSICTVTIAIFLASAIPASIALGGEGNLAQANPGYSGASGAANSQTVDDATLKQTARAFVKVRELTQKEQLALNGSKDDAAKEKVAEHTEAEKIAAVKAEGLQPQKYNQVIQLVQNDSGLRQKFLSYVNSEHGSQGNTM